MPELIHYEVRDEVAIVTLDSPGTRNALAPELVAQLLSALTAAQADGAVRVTVLTGAGNAFCAGADLRTRGRMGPPAASGRNPFVEVLRTIRHGSKPVIAAVNGAAFGGGAGLVAASDIAVASSSAAFSFSEVRRGVIPAMISVVVLPKLGEHQTMRLFLTGERFDAATALSYGLLHKVVPPHELMATVLDEATAIRKGGPIAIAEAKRLVRTVARLPEDEAFAYAEQRIGELFASDEASEGIAAFMEKRPPRWAKKDG
jgi:methylglutaconyl-CoA hydratase